MLNHINLVVLVKTFFSFYFFPKKNLIVLLVIQKVELRKHGVTTKPQDNHIYGIGLVSIYDAVRRVKQ